MTACDLDGAIRIAEYQEPGYTIWRCTWCGAVSDERVTTTDNTWGDA